MREPWNVTEIWGIWVTYENLRFFKFSFLLHFCQRIIQQFSQHLSSLLFNCLHIFWSRIYSSPECQIFTAGENCKNSSIFLTFQLFIEPSTPVPSNSWILGLLAPWLFRSLPPYSSRWHDVKPPADRNVCSSVSFGIFGCRQFKDRRILRLPSAYAHASNCKFPGERREKFRGVAKSRGSARYVRAEIRMHGGDRIARLIFA